MTREEAINIVRNIYQTDAEKEALQVLIPELAESEDEKIRKGLINAITIGRSNGGISFTEEAASRFIAWLEKHSEEEIRKIRKEEYTNGFNDAAGFGKQKEQKPWEWGEEETKLLDSIIDDYESASKSFCGYDGKIGLLRAIRDGEYDFPKGEWSEEDNIGWDEAFACVTRAEKAAKNEEELQNAVTAEKWLKEIKFKYYVHPVKQEWSEEDEKMIEVIKRIVFGDGSVKNGDRDKIHDWLTNKLKSLRPHISDEEIKKICSEEYTKGFNDAAFGGKLKEWGVEDEDRIRQIERIAQQAGCTQKLQEEIHDWLKSLRPSWKPSEEQMEALKECGECKRCIKKLYEDLQKRYGTC